MAPETGIRSRKAILAGQSGRDPYNDQGELWNNLGGERQVEREAPKQLRGRWLRV
jgi:hypothetical protein